jgi:hypothetical protein
MGILRVNATSRRAGSLYRGLHGGAMRKNAKELRSFTREFPVGKEYDGDQD